MISLPEEHELIGFFEVEPVLLDGDVKPWVYNELTFTTQRNEDEITVKICASYGELSVNWKKNGKQLLQLKLIDLDSINVEMQKYDEFLTAAGMFSDHAVLLKLRLKPEVAVEFEQQCIR